MEHLSGLSNNIFCFLGTSAMSIQAYLHSPPKAAAMLEALRGLGYSASSAVADIIDNSISASASIVEIEFNWNGPGSTITILDNGTGMSRDELYRALLLGDRNPLEERSALDLGRFGLGLKTASFSQCKQLTVASKKADSGEACLRWDLDYIASRPDDGWYMLEGYSPSGLQYVERFLQRDRGTLVLWETLDRLVTPGFREQDFLDLIDQIERHLSMVFHRYLAGNRPRLKILINGRAISSWDPFLSGHASTWSSPIERVQTSKGVVEIQCHVLPHKDRLDAKQIIEGGGLNGWTAQQGWYVYRNERLLLAGSWLGLGRGRPWTKEESYRLARLRIDIPNTADTDWKIDVRKSTARPPANIRERLTRIAEDTRSRARRVFAHRGEQSPATRGPKVAQAWRSERFSGGIRYRIDTQHPVVSEVLDTCREHAQEIRMMLRVLEETIPVQRIWLDTAEEKETPRTSFAGAPPEEVTSTLLAIYRNMVLRRGYTPDEARSRLRKTEPFDSYPEFVMSLPDVTEPEE